jgi:hypothetical protein
MRTAGEVAKALDLEPHRRRHRSIQMAESGELRLAARRYESAWSLAVSAAGTIVRLPTAGR